MSRRSSRLVALESSKTVPIPTTRPRSSRSFDPGASTSATVCGPVDEPNNPSIDIDFLEQFLRVQVEKKGRDLTYKDILKVATLSKELYEKTKVFRKQCYTTNKQDIIREFQNDLRNLTNLYNMEGSLMVGRDALGTLSYYVTSSTNIVALQEGIIKDSLQFFIRRNRLQDRKAKYLHFMVRFSYEGKIIGLDVYYGNAGNKESLFFYTQYPNFLKIALHDYTPAPLGRTGEPIYHKTVKENPLDIFHNHNGDMLIHKKLQNNKTYSFFRTYMMIPFIDYLVNEFDLDSITRKEYIKETIKENLLTCKEMIQTVAPYVIEGGKKRRK
jgi:hypothetical protein